MTIENPNVVDIVATRDDLDEVLLVITDHLEWQDVHQHLLTLQEKINGYLAFIESGELLRKYPNAAGKNVRIEVALKHSLPSDGEEFFQRARGIVERAGFRLSWRLPAA